MHPLIATRFPELERSLRAEHARTHAELSSDELGDAMRRFHASRTPDQALADFEHMLPALAPAEREQLLTSIRSTAPPAGFQRACKVARRVLDRDAWERIRACVSLP